MTDVSLPLNVRLKLLKDWGVRYFREMEAATEVIREALVRYRSVQRRSVRCQLLSSWL